MVKSLHSESGRAPLQKQQKEASRHVAPDARGSASLPAPAPVQQTQLFVTTKLWNDHHTNARSALNESLSRLGLDHVDLYLIHWPKPRQNAYVEAWKALVKLKEEGRAKSVGVSNFTVSHLKRIVDATDVAPSGVE